MIDAPLALDLADDLRAQLAVLPADEQITIAVTLAALVFSKLPEWHRNRCLTDALHSLPIITAELAAAA